LIFPDSGTNPIQFGSNPRALEERRIQQPSYLGTKSFIVPDVEKFSKSFLFSDFNDKISLSSVLGIEVDV
jgi:hypothetical protein